MHILLYPSQRESLIKQASVRYAVLADVGTAQEAKGAESVGMSAMVWIVFESCVERSYSSEDIDGTLLKTCE